MNFSSVLFCLISSLFLLQQVAKSQPLNPLAVLPTIYVAPGGNWVTGLTANIRVVNPSSQVVRAMLISFKVCHGTLTSLWNAGAGTFSSLKKVSTADYEEWILKVEGLTLYPGSTFDGIGFVLSNTAVFDVRRDVLVGGDLFYCPFLDCEGLACYVTCGDGLCSHKENRTGICPVDCTPNQCSVPAIVPQAGNKWAGVGTYVLSSPIYSWTSWVGGNIFVRNPSPTLTGVSYVMTIKYCTAKMILTALWGYEQQMVSYSAQYTVYRQVAKNLALAPNTNYNMAGMNFMIYSGANFNTHLAIRVDVYDYNVGCSVGDCVVTCGDGVCGSGETSSNCPIDCAPLSC